jgi:dGTPase
MDYDRIVYSSSLRRLQDKAQVFPLQENDFTRTRLTHSLETSALGRSLGHKAGRWIRKRHGDGLPEDFPGRLAALLQVAGLVHDLGNPPFGHYGEDLIRHWFKGEKNSRLAGLSQEEFSDFRYFDGNAQTIRILARLQFLKDRHGINFCFGTLGALMKYPWDSSDERARERGKFGFFFSEKDLGRRIIEETGMRGRHPATYLLEAADDLAYLFADLEDTVKKGHLNWEGLYGELVEDRGLWTDFEEARQALKREVDQLRRQRVPREEFDFLAAHFLKITGQVLGLEAVGGEFALAYEEIMNGTYRRRSLLEAGPVRPLIDRVRAVCRKYAYQNREVLSLELVAQSVVTGLLNRFIPALLSPDSHDPRSESGKLCRLISRNFEYIQKLDRESVYHEEAELSPYQRVQLGIDFISGMTDTYALNLHKRLLGLALPD